MNADQLMRTPIGVMLDPNCDRCRDLAASWIALSEEMASHVGVHRERRPLIGALLGELLEANADLLEPM
jgi:hypothetical protein